MRTTYRCEDCGANFKATYRSCSLCPTASGETTRSTCSSCGERLNEAPTQKCPVCGSTDTTRA